MKINEIMLANVLPKGNPNAKFSNEIKFDIVDGITIFIAHDADTFVLFTRGKEKKISAYIVLDKKQEGEYIPLIRIQKFVPTKGLISIIILALLRKGFKFIIRSTEELTPDGFRWISNIIKNGWTMFQITDQNGNLIDMDALEKEWEIARVATRADKKPSGKTSILIELPNVSQYDINEKVENWNVQWNTTSPLLRPYFHMYMNEELE
ncbi:Uncharacterised protein [uncultured archaeon]|nr:Uncharacterised protein [uncultured archaeon]